jgi:hypothetical protein
MSQFNKNDKSFITNEFKSIIENNEYEIKDFIENLINKKTEDLIKLIKKSEMNIKDSCNNDMILLQEMVNNIDRKLDLLIYRDENTMDISGVMKSSSTSKKPSSISGANVATPLKYFKNKLKDTLDVFIDDGLYTQEDIDKLKESPDVKSKKSEKEIHNKIVSLLYNKIIKPDSTKFSILKNLQNEDENEDENENENENETKSDE